MYMYDKYDFFQTKVNNQYKAWIHNKLEYVQYLSNYIFLLDYLEKISTLLSTFTQVPQVTTMFSLLS